MELKNINGISYQLINENNVLAVAHIATDHFIKNEHLIVKSGCNYQTFYRFIMAYCAVTLIEKLSLVAIDIKSNAIVGFAISEDPKSAHAVDANQLASLSENLTLIFKILDDLNHVSIDFSIAENDCFHLFVLGVVSEYQGKKIGKNLVDLSLKLARKRGFKYVLVEATSPITKPLCESLGFSVIGKLNYNNYSFQENRLSKQLSDYSGPHMLLKEL